MFPLPIPRLLPSSASADAALAVALAAALLAVSPGLRAAERSIDKQVVVKASLDEAWAAWTTREGITSFFAPDAVIEPRVGGAFHIHIDPLAPPGLKGADDMRFMAVQPKQMISFDWNAPPSQPEIRRQRTFVVVRFAPVDGGTRVSLHHTGWGEGGAWDQTYAYFDRAWGRVLGNLQTRFETGRPVDWTDWLAQLKKAHEAAAAASAPTAVAPGASR